MTAKVPALEYDRPYSVQFSQTQMKVSYRDDEGADKAELFELHRTRPERVFPAIRSVKDVSGRIWEYGMIPSDGATPHRYVTWPYEG